MKPLAAVEAVAADTAETSAEQSERNGGRRRRRRGRGGRGAGEGEAGAAVDQAAMQSEDTFQAADAADDEDLANKIAETMSYGSDEEAGGDEPRRRRRRRGRGGNRDGAARDNAETGQQYSETSADKPNEVSEESTEQPIAATGMNVSEMGLPAEPTQMGSTENNPDESNVAVAEVQAVQSVIAAVTQVKETSSAPVAETIEAPVEVAVETTVEATPLVVDTVEAAEAEQPAKQAAKLNKAELEQMLSSAGMLWVETDHEKWSVVQSSLAAVPKPVRVPRERKPVVQIATENLVLVETKPEFRSGSN